MGSFGKWFPWYQCFFSLRGLKQAPHFFWGGRILLWCWMRIVDLGIQMYVRHHFAILCFFSVSWCLSLQFRTLTGKYEPTRPHLNARNRLGEDMISNIWCTRRCLKSVVLLIHRQPTVLGVMWIVWDAYLSASSIPEPIGNWPEIWENCSTSGFDPRPKIRKEMENDQRERSWEFNCYPCWGKGVLSKTFELKIQHGNHGPETKTVREVKWTVGFHPLSWISHSFSGFVWKMGFGSWFFSGHFDVNHQPVMVQVSSTLDSIFHENPAPPND